MLKKIVFAAVGLSLLASPLIASAQIAFPADCSTTPTVACFENEIQQLIQIVNQLIATHGGNQGGSNNGQIQLSASATPSVVQNSVGTVQIKWDVRNAPSGAGIEIGIAGISGDDSVALSNILSPFLLDGTTRTVDLSVSGQTSMPSHGTINFPPEYFSGLLPISGPLTFTVTDSSGNVLAQKSVPLQIVANAPAQNFTASPTSGSAPLLVTFSGPSSGGAINFGDGQNGTIPPGQCGQTNTIGSTPFCTQGTLTHTYTAPGTYTATLGTPGGIVCPTVDPTSLFSVSSNWSCSWHPAQTLGTQTITVTSGSTNTGAFTISVNGKAFGATTFQPGTQNALVGQYALDATQSSENVRISGLSTILTQNFPSGLTNCAVYNNGTTQLTTGTHIFNSNINLSTPQTVTFLFDNPLTLPAGQVTILNIECNIPSALTSGLFSWGLSGGQSVGGTGVTSQQTIFPNVVPNSGYAMTIASTVGASGSLVASNPNPIQYSITSGGTTGVTVGSFTLQPSGESVNLQQIGLDLPAQQASPSDITRAYVYQGSSLLGTVIFTGSATSNCPPAFTGIQSGGCYFATTTVSSTLSQNTQANFTIKADIASIGVAQPGTSGDQIVVGLSDAEGSGANSGATINSGSAPAQVGVRVFKSYPTVTLVPLNSTNVDFSIGKQPALLRFSVTASPSGPIGLAYLTPRIVANGVTFSSVTTYAYTDPSYSQPVAGTVSSGGNLGTVNPSSGLTGSFSIPISNGSVPLEIPAGQTYYFQIVGNTASTQGNVSVITTLPGDTAYVPIGSYNGNVARFGSNANFVWSPNDFNTTQFADNDWTNGLGIPGLPLNGISQTRTGSGTQACPPGTSGIYPNCSSTTIPNPVLTFSAVPASVPSGASAALDWTAAYTGLCSITNTTTGVALDLSHANDNTFAAGYSSVSTGALSQTTTFELRCAPLTGATSGYAVKDVTVSVIPTASATVTYGSISGTTVTGTYAGLPSGSQIVVVNQTSGQQVVTSGGVSVGTVVTAGNGSFSILGVPSGAFYLKAVSPTGAYLAQSVVFYSSGAPPVPFACPVYQQLLCPAGQYLQVGAVTYDSNGCQVPHNTCAPIPPLPPSTTPTCTYGNSTINIEGGSDACRSWCLSLKAESPFGVGRIGGAPASSIGCVFMDSSGVQSTVAAANTNTNLANALTALEAALQAFLGKPGQ